MKLDVSIKKKKKDYLPNCSLPSATLGFFKNLQKFQKKKDILRPQKVCVFPVTHLKKIG